MLPFSHGTPAPRALRKLNSAAARLSRLVDIYVVDGQGETTLLPRPALVGAEFLDGGNVLRTAAGTNHHPLVVRRAEALAAIGAVANETAES